MTISSRSVFVSDEINIVEIVVAFGAGVISISLAYATWRSVNAAQGAQGTASFKKYSARDINSIPRSRVSRICVQVRHGTQETLELQTELGAVAHAFQARSFHGRIGACFNGNTRFD